MGLVDAEKPREKNEDDADTKKHKEPRRMWSVTEKVNLLQFRQAKEA